MIRAFRKNVLERDKYDELLIKEYLMFSDKIKDFLDKNKEYRPLPELIEDLFCAFYKYDPKFVDRNEIRWVYKLNESIIRKIMEKEKYRQLRRYTKLNPLNSTLATILFLDTISELIEKLKEINQNYNRVREIEYFGNEEINKHSFSFSLKKVLQDLENFSNAISGLSWGTGIGKFNTVDPAERMKLAEQLLNNKKIIELAKLLGNFRNFVISSYKNKIRTQSHEIYDTSLGNDLFHLLPSEYAKIHDEDLEYLFLKNYVEKKLQQYELSANKKEKGDFVVCLDLSGSMSGEAEIWAKAVALATLEIAMKENRSWILIPFDYDVHEDYIYKFDRKHKPSIEDIIDIAEMNFGGGTNFEKPLKVAMDMIKEMLKGDILFISDGYCDVSDEFLGKLIKWKEKTKTKIVSVAIDTTTPESLRKIADRVFEIDAFVDSYAKDVFQAVV